MEQQLKKQASAAEGLVSRMAILFISSELVVLPGEWDWEMSCEAVYCSDVIMPWPKGFEGSTGIIHPDDRDHLLEALQTDNETIPFIEFRIITTYGEIKQLRGTRLRVANGQSLLADPVIDFFDSAWQERQFQILNKRLIWKNDTAQRALQIAGTGIYYHRLQNGESWFSDMVFQIHGLLPQSLNANNNTFTQFIHKEDELIVADTIEKAYKHAAPVEIEYRIIRADGEEATVRHGLRWSWNSQGEKIAWGYIQDITKLRQQDQEWEDLRHDKKFQRQVLAHVEEHADTGCCFINLLTRKTVFTDNYYRLFGLRPAIPPLSATGFLNYVHSDDREAVKHAEYEMKHEHKEVELEFRIMKTDGKISWLHQRSRLLVYGEHEMIMLVSVRDITKQKLKDKRIQTQEGKLHIETYARQQAEQFGKLATWFWDLTSGEITYSDNLFDLLGYRTGRTPVHPKFFAELIHADDRKVFANAMRLVQENHQEDAFAFRIIRAGRVRHLKASFRVVLQQSRQIFVATFQDVTEETEMYHQLLSNIHFLDGMSQNIADMIIVTDLNYNIIEWNRKSEDRFGRKKNEVLNKNFFEIFPLLKTEEIFQEFRRVLNGQTINITQGNTPYLKGYYDTYLAPLKDADDKITGILHVIHDITKEAELQKALTERLTFIENLVESSVSRIIVLDRNMNYLYWNRKCEEYYGLRKQEVVGKNILDIFPGIQNNNAFADFKKALKGEQVQIPASSNLGLDEYSDTYLIPLKNEKQEVFGILWIVYDLTDKILAEEKVKETTRLFEDTALATPDAITVYDLENKAPVYLNNCMEAWLGYSNAELFRMGFEGRLQIIYDEDRDLLLAFNEDMKAAEDEQVLTAQYRIVTKYGKIIWVKNRSKVFRRNGEGKVTHILSILQDISSQKNAENEIIRVNEELSLKNLELIGINEELSSFAFVSSHELREPLNAVAFFIDKVIHDEEMLSDKARDFLRRSLSATRRMDKIIDDILALSRASIHETNDDKIELDEILEQVKADLAQQIENANAQIESSVLPSVQGVSARYFQLFKHLISNSIKFQEKGNIPKIKISGRMEDKSETSDIPIHSPGPYLHLSFGDNGIGFDMQHKTKIFNLFERLHGSYEYPGSGVGLTICKKIIDHLQGLIVVESKPGEGTVFEIYIPMNGETEASGVNE